VYPGSARGAPAASGMHAAFCTRHQRSSRLSTLVCQIRAADFYDCYFDRTILFAPFIPVIVVFCHAIEASDADDQQRLGSFIASLQQASSVSEAIDQLYRLTQVLHNIASVFIKSKSETADHQDMTSFGNDFNSFLSQLGFLPPTVEQMAVNGASLASSDDILPFQTQDWPA
jgi:hypothetical protein